LSPVLETAGGGNQEAGLEPEILKTVLLNFYYYH
jgi:hypothetical protein